MWRERERKRERERERERENGGGVLAGEIEGREKDNDEEK